MRTDEADSASNTRCVAEACEGRAARGSSRRQAGVPPTVHWTLSYRCNQLCTHCSAGASPWADTSQDLTTGECLGVIADLAELGISEVTLSGGEALLRPDGVDLMRALAARKIRIHLETNGTCIDLEIARLARDLQARNLLRVLVGIDGGTRSAHEHIRGPRSFDHLMYGLRTFDLNAIRFTLRCALSRDNYSTIPEILALAQDLYPNCEAVEWTLFEPMGRGAKLSARLAVSDEDLEVIGRLIGQHRAAFHGQLTFLTPRAPSRFAPPSSGERSSCPRSAEAAPVTLFIAPNGDLQRTMTDHGEPYRMGSLRQARLRDLWQTSRGEGTTALQIRRYRGAVVPWTTGRVRAAAEPSCQRST